MAKKPKVKHPASPSRKISNAWAQALSAAEWSLGTKVSALRDFIANLAEEDESVAEKFKDYIRELAEEEAQEVEKEATSKKPRKDEDDEDEDDELPPLASDRPKDAKPGSRKSFLGVQRLPKSKDVDAALDIVEELHRVIEEEVDERAQERGKEYFESIMQRSAAIGTTIYNSNRVSPGQKQALENMLNGARKWVH